MFSNINNSRATSESLFPGTSTLTRPDQTERLCWVCYCGDFDASRGQIWSRPCKCRGSMEWVHQVCLQRWINEMQRTDPLTPLTCRTCGHRYVIIYPTPGLLLSLLDLLQSIKFFASSCWLYGICVGCLYWSSVTYGAVTIIQIYGLEPGIQAMEHTNPFLLMIILPMIPSVLLLTKRLYIGDYFSHIWRRYIRHFPLLRTIYLTDLPDWRIEIADRTPDDELSVLPTLLCGALTLPFFATLAGRMFFNRFQSDLLRTFLGALLYIGVTGAIDFCYKELKFIRVCRRQIKDYKIIEDTLTESLHTEI